ncbi:hypothetical conserved protein [Candidatus Nitrosoglobus terrae]|uniref:Hypothetical conserved protein n=1 Tax=Candidatus Nitrosoglobus terrae TaxID=1630141 RepID=A0A1Q2SMD2_9GAMM|nr:hypothetical protein [Candidatus Nitrosoglobus terrae]BAW80281.1 hypothetical conserved protein [Candidatus Nitrosoglobus terrae]
MKHIMHCSTVRLRLFILGFIAVVACTACSESGKSTSSPTPTKLSGAISDENGPIRVAKLSATDSQGVVRATASLNGEQRYNLELPVETVYPVIISATYLHAAKAAESKEGAPAAEESHEAELRTVVLEPGSSIVDISLRSTQIVDIARARGGFTPENLAHASAAALNLGAGGGSGGGHEGH